MKRASTAPGSHTAEASRPSGGGQVSGAAPAVSMSTPTHWTLPADRDPTLGLSPAPGQESVVRGLRRTPATGTETREAPHEVEIVRVLRELMRGEGETRRLVRDVHRQVEEYARLQRMRKIG